MKQIALKQKTSGLMQSYDQNPRYLTSNNINDIIEAISSVITYINSTVEGTLSDQVTTNKNNIANLTNRLNNFSDTSNTAAIANNTTNINTLFSILQNAGNINDLPYKPYKALSATIATSATYVKNADYASQAGLLTNSILFKDINQNQKLFNGSQSIDLSNGINYATSSKYSEIANVAKSIDGIDLSNLTVNANLDGKLQLVSSKYKYDAISEYDGSKTIKVNKILSSVFSQEALSSHISYSTNKIENPIKFKDINGDTITYNASQQIDLTEGIYQAASASVSKSADTAQVANKLTHKISIYDNTNTPNQFNGQQNKEIKSILSSKYAEKATTADYALNYSGSFALSNKLNFIDNNGITQSYNGLKQCTIDGISKSASANIANKIKNPLTIYNITENIINYDGSSVETINSILSAKYALSAINSINALSANYATNSNTATFAQESTIAETSNTSVEASSALSANIALTAEYAITTQNALSALSADIANTTVSSQISLSSSVALSSIACEKADYAQYAIYDSNNNIISETYQLKPVIYQKNNLLYYGNQPLNKLGNLTINSQTNQYNSIIKDIKYFTTGSIDTSGSLVVNNGFVFVAGNNLENGMSTSHENYSLSSYTKIPNLNNIIYVTTNNRSCAAINNIGQLFVWGRADGNWFGTQENTNLYIPELSKPVGISLVGRLFKDIFNTPKNIHCTFTSAYTQSNLIFDSQLSSVYPLTDGISISQTYEIEFLLNQIEFQSFNIENIYAYILANNKDNNLIKIYAKKKYASSELNNNTLSSIIGIYKIQNSEITKISQICTQITQSQNEMDSSCHYGQITYNQILQYYNEYYTDAPLIPKWKKVVKGTYGYGALGIDNNGILYGCGKNKHYMFGRQFAQNTTFKQWTELPLNKLLNETEKFIDIQQVHTNQQSTFLILTSNGFVFITGNVVNCNVKKLPLYTQKNYYTIQSYDNFETNSMFYNAKIQNCTYTPGETTVEFQATYNYDYLFDRNDLKNTLLSANYTGILSGWYLWGVVNASLSKKQLNAYTFDKVALSPSGILGYNSSKGLFYNGVDIFGTSSKNLASDQFMQSVSINNKTYSFINSVDDIKITKDSIFVIIDNLLYFNSSDSNILNGKTKLNGSISSTGCKLQQFSNDKICNLCVNSDNNNTFLLYSTYQENSKDTTKYYDYITNGGFAAIKIYDIPDTIEKIYISNSFNELQNDVVINSSQFTDNSYTYITSGKNNICIYGYGNNKIYQKYYTCLESNNLIFDDISNILYIDAYNHDDIRSDEILFFAEVLFNGAHDYQLASGILSAFQERRRIDYESLFNEDVTQYKSISAIYKSKEGTYKLFVYNKEKESQDQYESILLDHQILKGLL